MKVAVASYLFVLLSCGTASSAPVNLNIKTPWLSGMERGDHSAARDAFTPMPKPPSSDRNRGRIRLDLSGKYHILLAEPCRESTEEDDLQPLVRLGITTRAVPSFSATVHYDFLQRWYGATRLIGNFQWKRKTSSSSCSSLPSALTLSAEHGLQTNASNNPAVALDLAWEGTSSSSSQTAESCAPRITARVEASNRAEMTFLAPLHRRLNLAWTFLWRETSDGGYYHESQASTLPSPEENEDWWIPDVQINTAGLISSRNAFRLSSSLAAGKQQQNNLGVKILIRRQLGWNAFGMDNSTEEQETLLRLQVSASVNGRASSLSTVTLDTALERMVESTRFTVSHEEVHPLLSL